MSIEMLSMKTTRFNKMIPVRWVFCLFCLAIALPGIGLRAQDEDGEDEVQAEMRVWTLVRGDQQRRFEAAFERLSSKEVRVRTVAGDPLKLPLDALCEVDMEYLYTVVIPEVTLKVRVKQDEKDKCRVKSAISESSSDQIITASLTAEIAKKGKFPYRGAMRAEAYLIGEEVQKTARGDTLYRLVARKEFPVTFTEENDERCVISLAGDFRHYLEYTLLLPRGCYYEGFVVVVYDAFGKIVAFDSNLSFMEPGDLLDKLRGYREFTFFTDTLRKQSVPQPPWYDNRIH